MTDLRSRAQSAKRRGGKTEARVVWPPEKRQSAREAIEALMRERGLARRFDRQVERAADRARESDPDAREESPARRDLRELPTFTVDPASAQDFDDAISAEALPGDAVRVWVHIADVSAYVKEGSKVFSDPGGAEGLAGFPDGMLDAVVEAAEECPGECIFIEAD